MIEKVNPAHPDKLADRIAGAIVDMAYRAEPDPKIAVEVLLGHGVCNIIAEASVYLYEAEVADAVRRIIGFPYRVVLRQYAQDRRLAGNQEHGLRCGDNGIFRGVPLTDEQKRLSEFAHSLYAAYPFDGKYILDGDKLTICQSNADSAALRALFPNATVNPLGDWTGGPDVDSGAVNRKLGSDMADSVTGGGIHGKDLSKADVSVNIYAFLKAQAENRPVEICCAIGDDTVDGKPYTEIVELARSHIQSLGGFEKFAEWGLF